MVSAFGTVAQPFDNGASPSDFLNLTKLLLTGMVIGPRGRGRDASVRLTEGADWSYDGGGLASGTGPGEVERHGAEGHGWLKSTHPSMMMMIVIVQQLSDIYRSRNVFIIEEIY